MEHRIQHPNEPESNRYRDRIQADEPLTLRTFTPTLAILAKAAGVFVWTPEGRQLYDFTSGVLVANLGHNPRDWLQRWFTYMQWPMVDWAEDAYCSALPMTAYNAVTPVEVEATRRLLEVMRSRPGGGRMEQVMWAASGSEAIQKALWASLARDRARPMILATRYGFHGKKGLAGAVTGCETDPERDPRVRFIGFPMNECADVSMRSQPFDPSPYRRELEQLKRQYGMKIGTLITEPYLGGGGSYHPPKQYLQTLQEFCRENDIIFILDEVQANFGRTGELFAYETYGIEPDIVVLGKGLANGVPVAAAVGRRDVFGSLGYGIGSDTWSANPLCCAGVCATLDAYADGRLLEQSRRSSRIIEEGLVSLKRYPFVSKVRGEDGGMVWGVETRDHAGKSAADWANALVLAAYRGVEGRGIHLLGPLAGKVIRVAPPLVITEQQARDAIALLDSVAASLAE